MYVYNMFGNNIYNIYIYIYIYIYSIRVKRRSNI